MKKTELKNCPQWLLDAKTENEDVDFDGHRILIWRGFLSGDFRGENFRGGNFRGEKLSRTPIYIGGLRWFVICTPKNLHIGCQHHSHEEWKNFNDEQICNMASGATEFWHNKKAFLLSICDREAQL